jgi:hypothetical protein
MIPDMIFGSLWFAFSLAIAVGIALGISAYDP